MPGPRFTDIRRFDSIDSTNRYLLDEARSGAPEGIVAVAGYQTAGRGRLGRGWEAPPGSNLLVSVLLRPDLAPERRHLASAVVALAAGDAVASTTGVEPGIKWPNDLVAADGRKLAGVLAEADLASVVPSVPPPIVVGVGVNANWPATDAELPPELVGVATSLRQQAGRAVDVEELLQAFLVALGPRSAELATPAGQARQASDLRAGCTTIGTRVRIELADDRFEGTASGVTDEGHLVVASGGTDRTVVAGDVVHVRPEADRGARSGP